MDSQQSKKHPPSLSQENGWKEGAVDIKLPAENVKQKSEADAPSFWVEGIYYRSIVEVIKTFKMILCAHFIISLSDSCGNAMQTLLRRESSQSCTTQTLSLRNMKTYKSKHVSPIASWKLQLQPFYYGLIQLTLQVLVLRHCGQSMFFLGINLNIRDANPLTLWHIVWLTFLWYWYIFFYTTNIHNINFVLNFQMCYKTYTGIFLMEYQLQQQPSHIFSKN